MKHAILITAYKDVESLIELIEILGSGFNFYIHIDRKKKINTDRLIKFENVQVFNTFNVNWGGVNHFRAILKLSQQALKNPENTFFHLITAEDFPIKSSEYILNIDTSKSYINYFPFPKLTWDENGGTDRYSYFHLYDVFNAKTKMGGRSIHLLVLLQKVFRFRRANLNFPQMFGGSTYWSINRRALNYLLEYIDGDLLNRLKFTFCAEEYIFHSILLNSPLKNEISNTNLRYIDWHSKRMGNPAFLDETDFDILVNSDGLFARKIKKSPNSKLIGLLRSHIKV